jgi:hypothetical protein
MLGYPAFPSFVASDLAHVEQIAEGAMKNRDTDDG